MDDTLPSLKPQTITAGHSGEDTQVAKRGDHLIVFRPLFHPLGYYHHGIYVGGGKVIHYSGTTEKNAIICRDSVAVFEDGGEVRIICHEDGKHYPPERVVQEAGNHLDKKHFRGGPYRFFLNNCEHFARWCKTGIAESKQTQRLLTTAAGGVLGRLAIVRLLSMGIIATGPLGWVVTVATIVIGAAVKVKIGKKAIFTEDEQ